jgi:hypothetical protein
MIRKTLQSLLLLASVVFVAQVSWGDELKKACNDQYKADMETCHAESEALPKKERGEYRKACHTLAKIAKKTCLNGVPDTQCMADCQQVYDDDSGNCDIQWGSTARQLNCIPGDDACFAEYESKYSACLESATNSYNACIAACPSS